MGLFTVVIDEMEDLLHTVTQQVDVSEQARDVIQSGVNALVGQSWQGAGAEAFQAELDEFVLDKLKEIFGFTGDFTKGITNTINFLREMDDLLGGLFGI